MRAKQASRNPKQSQVAARSYLKGGLEPHGRSEPSQDVQAPAAYRLTRFYTNKEDNLKKIGEKFDQGIDWSWVHREWPDSKGFETKITRSIMAMRNEKTLEMEEEKTILVPDNVDRLDRHHELQRMQASSQSSDPSESIPSSLGKRASRSEKADSKNSFKRAKLTVEDVGSLDPIRSDAAGTSVNILADPTVVTTSQSDTGFDGAMTRSRNVISALSKKTAIPSQKIQRETNIDTVSQKIKPAKGSSRAKLQDSDSPKKRPRRGSSEPYVPSSSVRHEAKSIIEGQERRTFGRSTDVPVKYRQEDTKITYAGALGRKVLKVELVEPQDQMSNGNTHIMTLRSNGK